MRFIDKDGVARHGRYRITPDAGVEHLDAAALKGRDANYLFDEIKARTATGPVRFHIQVQVAGEKDIVNDATSTGLPIGRWSICVIELTAEAPNNQSEQQHIIFDPIPRVDGIEPSDDPLIELRAAVYLLSGRKRREVETPTHRSSAG